MMISSSLGKQKYSSGLVKLHI